MHDPFILVCSASVSLQHNLAFLLDRMSLQHIFWNGLDPFPVVASHILQEWIVLVGPCFDQQHGKSLLDRIGMQHSVRGIYLRDPFSPHFDSMAAAQEHPPDQESLDLPLNVKTFYATIMRNSAT